MSNAPQQTETTLKVKEELEQPLIVNDSGGNYQSSGAASIAGAGEPIYTKFDSLGLFILLSLLVGCALWMVFIIEQFVVTGTDIAFCGKSYISCYGHALSLLTPSPTQAPIFFGGDNDFGWDPNADGNVVNRRLLYADESCCAEYPSKDDLAQHCVNVDDETECRSSQRTVIPFLVQVLFIVVMCLQMYLIFKYLRTGITVYEPPPDNTDAPEWKRKLLRLQDAFEANKINCRRCAYVERDTPQETARMFLLNGLFTMNLALLIPEVPLIVLNLMANDPSLRRTGYLLFTSVMSNVFLILYARFSPCCNPCTGRCCGDSGCFLDPLCKLLGCSCCFDGHFPPHHVAYVGTLLTVLEWSTFLKYSAALSKVSAIAFVDSVDLWHLLLACLNFISGVLSLISLFRVYWRCFYVACFYWTRDAVHELESEKLRNIIQGLMEAVVIFHVKVEKSDAFITVGSEKKVAKKVHHKCDIFVCGLVTVFLFVGISLYGLFHRATKQMNEDFTMHYH